MNTDDLARIQADARQHVAKLFDHAQQQFIEPDLERQELSEYDGMTPEQHGQLMQVRGKKDYKQYAEEMERLRGRWGWPTGEVT